MPAILDLLLPPACSGCGSIGSLLCDRCLAALRSPSAASDRFVAPDPGIVVGNDLTLAVAALAYGGPLRRALAALKYTGTSRQAAHIAMPAAAALRHLTAISGVATLVPVPVHRERQRARGYNQAELLARELSRLSDLPIAELLVRTRPTTKQHRLDRAARLANLRDAFAVAPGVRMPTRAILVDDIITTTATLETCAAMLRGAGVGEVYGFAIAREV